MKKCCGEVKTEPQLVEISDVWCKMSNVRRLWSGVRCQMYYVRLISDFVVWCIVWCLLSDVKRLMSDVRHLMSDVLCLMSDSVLWCMMSGVCCLRPDVWCKMSDVRRLLSDVLCQMSDERCLMSKVWCQMSDVRDVCLLSGVWCLKSAVLCLMYDIWCLMYYVWCLMYCLWCLMFVWFNRGFTVLFIRTLTSVVHIPGTSENVSPMTETLNSKFWSASW